MAAPRLTTEQQDILLKWLTAEYSEVLIRRWFIACEWEPLSAPALTYYRRKHAAKIEQMRIDRHTAAISRGLALKAERVQRLADHADELDAIKWVPDEKGRLWNEKAWRETLDDIAKEMGHRRQGIDVALEQELNAALDQLQHNLSAEEYAKVLAILTRTPAA